MAFLQTFVNVVMIVVLAVPGYLLRKTKLFPDKAASILAVLLLYISQPFLMMSSLFNKEFRASMLVNFAWVLFFAVALQLIVYFAAKLLFCKEKNEAARRACVASSYLGNVGFMGIPVMQMLFPGNDEMVLYTVVYNIAFNAMTWTLGVFAITGDKKRINPLKIVLNPPTIAVIVALPFFFLNVHIPEQVMTPIGYLGNMTLPLSMIILGVRLADMHFVGGRQKIFAEEVKAFSEDYGRPLAGGAAPDSAKDGEPAVVTEISDIAAGAEVPDKEGQTALPTCLSVSSAAGTFLRRRGILDDVRVYMVSFVKLVLSPLLGFAVMLLLRLAVPIDRYVIIALFIIGAMPTASSALNFAEMFGGDKETAAAATLMNTLLCIVTIPVLMLLCDLI